MEEKPDFDKSEFNSAFWYMRKINELLDSCDLSSVNLDVYLWFRLLYGLKRRLSIKMKPEDRAAFDLRLEQINVDIEDINNKLINNKKSTRPEIYNSVYKKLHILQEDLTILADKYGLLIKNMDDPTLKFFG